MIRLPPMYILKLLHYNFNKINKKIRVRESIYERERQGQVWDTKSQSNKFPDPNLNNRVYEQLLYNYIRRKSGQAGQCRTIHPRGKTIFAAWV
ncbi:MAG: hypothetical protein GTN53_34490 [Candidatus Aminicenantes bacterium]|nr:hypothetical protein [Candidatus Aminicenantes bacterium]NIQ71573.1 hypothetical protein [Candidatus Aminicenantes bacterium]NIT27624.1 hypothetical protein [Candidatus Aminicenantes bacterium]